MRVPYPLRRSVKGIRAMSIQTPFLCRSVSVFRCFVGRSRARRSFNVGIRAKPRQSAHRLELADDFPCPTGTCTSEHLHFRIDTATGSGYLACDHESHRCQFFEPSCQPPGRTARSRGGQARSRRRGPAPVRRGWQHDRDAPARRVGFVPRMHLGRVEPTC